MKYQSAKRSLSSLTWSWPFLTASSYSSCLRLFSRWMAIFFSSSGVTDLLLLSFRPSWRQPCRSRSPWRLRPERRSFPRGTAPSAGFFLPFDFASSGFFGVFGGFLSAASPLRQEPAPGSAWRSGWGRTGPSRTSSDSRPGCSWLVGRFLVRPCSLRRRPDGRSAGHSATPSLVVQVASPSLEKISRFSPAPGRIPAAPATARPRYL